MAKNILPLGDYKVSNVGPSRDWSFKGDNGDIPMKTDSIQFEGHEDIWVDVNRGADKDAPKIGEVLRGDITQDDAGKYAPKLNKEKKGGGRGWGGGGGQATPGAIWSTAVATAVEVVAQYAVMTGKKPKSLDDFLAKVEAVAPKVNGMVDRLVAANKPADAKAAAPATESGESAAPAAAKPVDDITEDDLGDEDW